MVTEATTGPATSRADLRAGQQTAEQYLEVEAVDSIDEARSNPLEWAQDLGSGPGSFWTRMLAVGAEAQRRRENGEALLQEETTTEVAVDEDGRLEASAVSHAAMQKTIQAIGGAVIGAFLIIIVLSQVYQLDIISSSSGPFGSMIEEYVTYATAALSLVGIGLVIYGASYAMNMFSGWGGR